MSEPQRLRTGIIGGGLITQVEHLPNLLALPEMFAVAGVVDPSAAVRAHLARRWGVPAFETTEALLSLPLDAVVIATPDCFHAELAIMALTRGLHVFCEKPLCYSPEEADQVAQARDRAGRVVQVGTMKRFDPSFRLLRELVAGRGERLRYISVEVNDPDSWPFSAHHDFLAPDDVSPELVKEARAKRDAQLARVLGGNVPPHILKGSAGPFFSSLVHDVNLVHGLLDAMGLKTEAVASAALFAGGEAGHATVRLGPAPALWSMSHIAVPRLADYLERVSLCFDDRIYELHFPSPYLNHQATRLLEKMSSGHHAQTVEHRASYQEAFVEELRAWHQAIIAGTEVENSVEAARRDIALIGEMARAAAAAHRA